MTRDMRWCVENKHVPLSRLGILRPPLFLVPAPASCLPVSGSSPTTLLMPAAHTSHKIERKVKQLAHATSSRQQRPLVTTLPTLLPALGQGSRYQFNIHAYTLTHVSTCPHMQAMTSNPSPPGPTLLPALGQGGGDGR